MIGFQLRLPRTRRPSTPALLLLLFTACGAERPPETTMPPLVVAPDPAPAAEPLHGRLEEHQGLRVLRTWGTPEQRGYAHGRLLGRDIAATAAAELGKRFGRKPAVLRTALAGLERTIAFPPDQRAEIEAVWRGVVDSGAPLRVDELDRDLGLPDLLLANALDVYGLMGCSGLTVWGEQSDGGGVLTARNFDWPFTGPHMVDQVLLLVQHQQDGRAVATVTWPGYVASVTGFSSSGVAAFLHVGNANVSLVPQPESWPTAVAARAILEQVAGDAGAAGLARARELLGYTSAPAGYITRVVLPQPPPGAAPVGLFETDRNKVVQAVVEDCEIVTNHFQGRDDARPASKDSTDRHKTIQKGLAADRADGGRVGPEQMWAHLQAVQRGGGRAFGTLHSLVFRHEPWCCELRIAEHDAERGLLAAPSSGRRWALPRAVVFPPDGPWNGGR